MIVALALLATLQQVPPAAVAPAHSYLFFVASEGTDQVALVRFGPKGMRVEHRTTISLTAGSPATPAEVYTDSASGKSYALTSAHGLPPELLVTGPRYLAITRDGRSYLVTSMHGFPAGELVKVRIAADSGRQTQPPDTIQGREPLGGSAGAIQLSADGTYADVIASASTADSSRSGIVIVDLTSMVEVARIATCTPALGAQLTADGSRLFSLCPGADALLEIDMQRLAVTRRLPLSSSGEPRCTPVALASVPDGSRIYVACGASGEIVAVNGATWSVAQRTLLGAGSSALALSPDGRTLVVGNTTKQTVTLVDVAAKSAPLPVAMSGRPVEVAVSSDNRYAFVTLTRSATESAMISVIDLQSHTVVASLTYGRQLAGIAFWKVQP